MSNKKYFQSLGFIATFILGAILSVNASANPAPDFTLQSSTGENVRLAEQRG